MAILTLALALVGAVAWWTWDHNDWIGKFSDSISYLLLADYYTGAGKGHYSPGIEHFYKTTRFPPLFGWLLAAGGGGTSRIHAAVAITQALVALGGAFAAAYLVKGARGLLVGALLMLSVALCPGPYLVAIDPVSEPLFVFLLYAGLFCAYRRDRSALAIFSLAPLARTAGVVLAPAMALRAWREGPREGRWVRAAGSGFVVLLPTLLWTAYRRLVNPTSETYLDYLRPAFADQGGVWTWLTGQPLRLIRSLTAQFDPGMGAFPTVLVLVLLAAALLGAFRRFRRNELDVQVAACYLALVVVWPFPVEQPRMLGILLPILLLCAYEGCSAVLARAGAAGSSAGIAAVLSLTLTFAAAAPSDATIVRRALAEVPEELEPYKRGALYLVEPDDQTSLTLLEIDARIRYAIESLPEYVPAQDCVYSFSPLRTAVFGHRGSELMPGAIDPARPLRAQFAACRYLLVTYESTLQYREAPLFPTREVHDIARPVFASRVVLPDGYLVAAALLEFKE